MWRCRWLVRGAWFGVVIRCVVGGFLSRFFNVLFRKKQKKNINGIIEMRTHALNILFKKKHLARGLTFSGKGGLVNYKYRHAFKL